MRRLPHWLVTRVALAPIVLAVPIGCVTVEEEADQGAGSAAVEVSATGREIVTVTDSATMTYLEEHGFSFAERFAGLPDGDATTTGAELAASARYRDLTASLTGDVLDVASEYAARGWALPAVASSDRTAREILGGGSYQAFNYNWLTSSASHFELIGVVNRFDRRVLPHRAATCGELRLIYRLAYTGPRESSRLPLTVVAVFPQRVGSCASVASSWIVEGAMPEEGDGMAGFLANGPLRDLRDGRADAMSFELNGLVDLWSRFVRTDDGVGRHHQYTLRVFRPTAEGLEPEPLENTPDVTSVLAAPEKKAALLRWIAENRTGIESGTASLPALADVGEIRATRVSSFTAMGLTRATNRPFSQIFMDDLASVRGALALSSDGEARALLRRLDMTTCNGCHATRSVVGLHLVGHERDDDAYRNFEAHSEDPRFAVDQDRSPTTSAAGNPKDRAGRAMHPAPIVARVVANRMAAALSPHLRDENERRARDLATFRENGGRVPMPPADRGAFLKGSYGSICALADAAALAGPDVDALKCNPGLRCVALDDSGYGQCIPAYERAGDVRQVGDPYEVQSYSTGTPRQAWATATFFSERGPLVASRTVACSSGGQTGRENGFPFGGICSPISGGEGVADLLESSRAPACAVTGGSVPLGASAWVTREGRISQARVDGAREIVCGLAPFQGRVSATWGHMSTAAMAWNSVAPGFQPACDEDNPCRDEYVCMRRLPGATPSERDPHKGTCMPGYVLAQLEIDSHKVPDAPAPCMTKRDGRVVDSCPR